MIIGVGLDGRLRLSLAELRAAGSEAARCGFESIWTPAGTVPDAFHVCAQWSQASAEVLGVPLRTGTSVVPAPRLWRPVALAMQAATVALFGEGRFVLGIGTGGAGPAFFAQAGFENRPLAVMRDYLEILRPLLRGEEVTYTGPALSVSQAHLGADLPTTPVYLAALGPQMLHLVGEAADGACLNWATPAQVAWSREQVNEGARRAGRDPAELTLS